MMAGISKVNHKNSKQAKLEIIQWNCRGFRDGKKRATLHLYLQTLNSMPAVIALQETGLQAKLPGYNSFQGGTSTCILVHKECTARQIDLDLSEGHEYTMVNILPNKRRDPSVYVLNVYSSPKCKRSVFNEIFYKAVREADKHPLVIVGDFNAPSYHWGYTREIAKGRKLAELISTLRLSLLTDPMQPTRVGNSVNRDTCPDLTLVKNISHATWENLDDTLGSDHCLLKITISAKVARTTWSQAKLTNWTAFRSHAIPSVFGAGGYTEWAKQLTATNSKCVTILQTTEDIPAVDNHLLHLWEARRSLTKRWRKNKLNRKLKLRIAELSMQAAEYAAQLNDSNWTERCNAVARQMNSKGAWRLFRSLIDPTQTRGETQKQLRRALQGFHGTNSQLADALCDKYLCRMLDPDKTAYEYAGRENHQLDAPFAMHDLKAALGKMRRGTAPGRDHITVTLLVNLSDDTYWHLLEYINAIWDGQPLPIDWKTALVTFIPKPGKQISTDNLRPISLTSCVGKLMEAMVRDRLSPYLESKGYFADTMFGFRPHMSAQDVLLQLNRDIIQPTYSTHNDRAILALDLKGAFDNVKHEIILTNLSHTHCGRKTFAYIRDFLSDRLAILRIDDEEHGPFKMGTRGTPQGAVISPLLFNIAMMNLPQVLAQVEGVHHALYADDVTIWANQGSIGEMEDRLQQAASIVDAYATQCGLQCATAKSELLHIRANVKDRTTLDLTLSGGSIRVVSEIRILGLLINNRTKNGTTLDKLSKVGEQVGRMIRRVSNKRGGLRGRDALRLAHAFVTSRILYSTPYLRMTKHDENRADVILRKVTKRALDLPISTSNQKLSALGVLNSIQELREAHLTNQYTRLMQTAPGRRLLDRLCIQHNCEPEHTERIPELWRTKLWVPPLPRNMTKETHEGRRQARAKAQERQLGSRTGVYYVDVAGPSPRGYYTAAVVHQGTQVDGLSFRAANINQAEEVAVALAAAHPQSKCILTDSRRACENYLAGEISPLANKILRLCIRDRDPAPKRIIWTPGHQGLRGNEAADAAARALIPREPPCCPKQPECPTPLLRFSAIRHYFCEQRRVYPPPAKGLSKTEERVLRRLQTNTLLCPAIVKHFDPKINGQCQHCGNLADLYHMVWACQQNPNLSPIPHPTREDWEATVLNSSGLEKQRALVQRARVAASTNDVPD